MRRFWQDARAVSDADVFLIELDGKTVRLPNGEALRVRSEALAQAVAGEWRQAGGEFSMESLPLTRLASTAQQRIAPDKEPTAMGLARYAESDLLCYRASAPDDLVARQTVSWQPWLDRAAARYGVQLRTTTGIGHVAQDTAALAIFAAVVAVCDAATIAGLGVLVPALGSLVLGLAVVEGALAPKEAFHLSVLDELFQAESWGEDAQAAARRAEILDDIEAAARFVDLARK